MPCRRSEPDADRGSGRVIRRGGPTHATVFEFRPTTTAAATTANPATAAESLLRHPQPAWRHPVYGCPSQLGAQSDGEPRGLRYLGLRGRATGTQTQNSMSFDNL